MDRDFNNEVSDNPTDEFVHGRADYEADTKAAPDYREGSGQDSYEAAGPGTPDDIDPQSGIYVEKSGSPDDASYEEAFEAEELEAPESKAKFYDYFGEDLKAAAEGSPASSNADASALEDPEDAGGRLKNRKSGKDKASGKKKKDKSDKAKDRDSGYDSAYYRNDWDRYRKDFNPGYPGKKKSHKGFLVFLAILIVIAALCIGAYFILGHFGIGPGAASDTHIATGPYIAQVDINGTIEMSSSSGVSDIYDTSAYSQQYIMSTIDYLRKDSNCKAIVMYINTPGGSVYATDEVYQNLIEFKQETKKPVFAIMGPTCASGGYYIACAADRIFANRNTTTGSIGVTFGTQLNISGLLEKYGITAETIASGPNKSMGSMYEPMTDEQRAIYQSMIDEAYAQFTAVVATGRSMTADQVLPLADGRVYTATQAKDCGLIDDVCNYDTSIQAIKADTGIKKIYRYSYQPETTLKDILLGFISRLSSSSVQSSDLAQALKLAEQAYKEPYYIYQTN